VRETGRVTIQVLCVVSLSPKSILQHQNLILNAFSSIILFSTTEIEGNDSWEKRGHRSILSEDNTAKETPSSSSRSREQKSPDDRRRKSYSSSDSEDSSKFRTKQASRWGQKYQDGDGDGDGNGEGMGVIVSSPEDMHPRVSLSEPDIRYDTSHSSSLCAINSFNFLTEVKRMLSYCTL
jgi:hypothetical protein